MPSPVPYCGPPPDPAGLWLRWNTDPVAWAALALLAAGYLVWRGRGDGRAFWLGWAALAVALVSPLCAASSALFSARAVHHLVLILAAAPLLTLGGLRIGRGSLTAPALAQAAMVWLWSAPAIYGAALAHDGLYWAMQAALLGSALWFWSGVFARGAGLGALAALGGTGAQMGLLAALITFAPAPLYAPHSGATAAFGLTALEDQQLAGLIMWAPGALPYLLVLLAMAWRMLEGAETVRA